MELKINDSIRAEFEAAGAQHIERGVAKRFRIGDPLRGREAEQRPEGSEGHSKPGTPAFCGTRDEAKRPRDPVDALEGNHGFPCYHPQDMHEVPPSVLLVRLDAIGDALALTPLLAAFRERGIPVDIVLFERNAEVFSSRAYRRRLRPQDVQPGLYTHALVATEDAEGYRIAERSAAPVRIGFENGWGKPFKTWWVRSLLTKTIHRTAGLDRRSPHECEVLFRLASTLLGESEPTRDVAQLRPLVIGEEPTPDARIVVQVTDKWERLGIAFNDVVSCARRLVGYCASSQEHTAGVRFISSSQEDIYVDAFEKEIGLPIERFGSLTAWKNTIAVASALVAPDSGAIHVAGMTGVPTVAIFPPGRTLAMQVSRWRPWAAPYRIVPASHDWPRASIEALRELL